jgi:hypothetical protein
MPDPTTFEARLAAAFDLYAAGAPVAVDPRVVTSAALASGVGRWSGWRSTRAVGRGILVPIAIGLLIVAIVAGAVMVGSQAEPRPTVLPTAVPTQAAPTVLPTTAPTAVPAAVAPTGLPRDASGYRGVFAPAADMSVSRIDPVVVTLADGRVLIAAGEDVTPDTPQVPVVLLDPATGRSTTIAEGAPSGREGGSGVLLPDGRVFMIVRDGNSTSSAAYLVDPRSMTSHQVPYPPSSAPIYTNAPVFGVNPTMALLHDGRVLIAGGLADVYKSDLLATAQLFDPTTETFTPTGSMAVRRWRHSMTTLPDGRVLVAGGEGRADVRQPSGDPLPPDYRSDAEIYDPKTGKFTPTGAMSQVRGATLAVPLPTGRVVVLPRFGSFSVMRLYYGPPLLYDPMSPAPVEIYDATTGTFSSGGTTPGVATSATLLRSGRILLTGTVGTPANGEALGTWAAVYDPYNERTEGTASPRAWSAAPAVLADGRVLFAGGGLPRYNSGWPLAPVPWVDIFE